MSCTTWFQDCRLGRGCEHRIIYPQMNEANHRWTCLSSINLTQCPHVLYTYIKIYTNKCAYVCIVNTNKCRYTCTNLCSFIMATPNIIQKFVLPGWLNPKSSSVISRPATSSATIALATASWFGAMVDMKTTVRSSDVL